MFDLVSISKAIQAVVEIVNPPVSAAVTTIDHTDFLNPCKELPITAAMETQRLQMLRDPVLSMDILQWIGWSLEDVWVDSRKFPDKIWNKWNAAIISWLTNGTIPEDISIPNKAPMRDTLLWWSQAPTPVKDLVEPIIEHWKIWAYYPHPTWEYQYDREKVIYVPEALLTD